MKRKSRNKLIGIFVLFVVIAGLLFLYLPKTPTSETYFYNDDFGIVKITISQPTSVKQIMLAPEGSYTSVNPVQVSINKYILMSDISNFPCTQYTIQKATIYIKDSSNTIVFTNNPSTPSCGSIDIRATFTPTKAGSYQACNTYTLLDKTTNKVSTLTPQCQGFTVTSAPLTDCDNHIYDNAQQWHPWSNIVNGIIEERATMTFYGPPGCGIKSNSVEYRTICNDNFVVQGIGKIASGKQTCSEVVIEDPVIDDPAIEVCPLSGMTKPECDSENGDTYLTCDDGSIITTTQCVDGCSNYLDNKCADGSDNGNNNDVDEDNNDGDIIPPDPQFNPKILIFSIIGLLFVILIIVFIKKFRR